MSRRLRDMFEGMGCRLADVRIRRPGLAALRRVANSRFLSDVRLLASGIFVAQLSLLLLSPVLTRLFTPADFGVFALVMAVAGIGAVFSTLRLDVIIPIVRQSGFVLPYVQAMLLTSVAVAAIIMVVLLLFGDAIAGMIPAGTQGVSRAALYLVPVLLVDLACFAAAYSWSVREGRFRRVGRAQIARAGTLALVSITLGLLAFVETAGVSLLLGQLAGDVVFVAVLAAAFPRGTLAKVRALRVRRLRAALRAHRTSLQVLSLTQVMAAFYERASVFVIAIAFGPVEAGFYALATRVAGAPVTLVSTAIGDVFRQRAARLYNAGGRIDVLMRKGLGLTLALSVLPFALVIWLMPGWVVPVFGAEWSGAVFTLKAMLIAAFFRFNSGSFDKIPVIVQAHRFIVGWHGARLLLEVATGALALAGVIDYESYLLSTVVGRVVSYLVMLGKCHSLARRHIDASGVFRGSP